ncbi:hypothetical protein B0H16DRAFT_1552098 [Mycena metata]|uniref:DUF5648 domain-containing protein n=1 Tax=Mycena metata TaxID=1033252 RepID=A0AAD7ISP0_9AGAR|nr:hypothetical protein B0H16DRAFT_1552098 [Mycena metata]
MKFLSVVLLAIATVISATEQCPSCPAIIPLFRSFVLTDHFYTEAPSEVISAGNEGYSLEGIGAGIFPTQITSSTPLFRLFKNAVVDHAYTTSTDEVVALEAEGYVLERTPGFVYTTQICNSVPLYGLFLVSMNDHFLTTSTSERASAIAEGYTDQGIVAYVPAPSVIVQGNSC